ncbi:MAG: hypothetical protein A2W31_10165 [Planctomycetes bacterium RBG_16_64_10]|nr:MAG: hypothetical protein A2W31_10165 [Planctomycetes bacterium RBG_16_64_10]
MRTAAGALSTEDGDLRAAATRAAATTPVSAQQAALEVERCLVALAHVDRNLNQTTLLECWLDDLRRIAAGEAMDLELNDLVVSS